MIRFLSEMNMIFFILLNPNQFLFYVYESSILVSETRTTTLYQLCICFYLFHLFHVIFQFFPLFSLFSTFLFNLKQKCRFNFPKFISHSMEDIFKGRRFMLHYRLLYLNLRPTFEFHWFLKQTGINIVTL